MTAKHISTENNGLKLWSIWDRRGQNQAFKKNFNNNNQWGV